MNMIIYFVIGNLRGTFSPVNMLKGYMVWERLGTPGLVHWINHLKNIKQVWTQYLYSPMSNPLDTRSGSDKCLPHFICIICSLYQCFRRHTNHI